MRKIKGFTLIELLAVIVILAVIALIATPLILGVIERTQKSAYEASLRSVFSATELYIATAEFGDIPEEGIPIIDESIKLKNKEFTSGKIVKNEQGEIVLQDVSNGVYCGGGTLDNLVVVKGNCYSADTTPPTDVTIGFGTITSSSIEIVADALDVESAISGYEFSIDDGSTWTSKQTSNVYTFTNLTNNAEYTFKIRATNNNNLTTDSNSLLVSTNDIPLPSYSINTTDWTASAVVTIIYPEREAGYIYEYSLDDGSTWEEVASPSVTKDITFNSNGSVIARISDGTNIVSGVTYQVTNIDTTPPIITVEPTELTILVDSIYTDGGVTAIDAEMGDITSDILVTGTIDTATEGTYILTYNVSDVAGNVAAEVIRTVTVIPGAYTFSYTGDVQTWTVSTTGIYKLEVWGAQGGNGTDYSGTGSSHAGGKGGYATGNLSLTSGQTLYVYIGGSGSTCAGCTGGWNGGGSTGNASYNAGTGGGATDIRIGGNSLSDRIIVAGGGGGGGNGSIGGAGGGSNGQKPPNSTQYSGRTGGIGGTQTSGYQLGNGQGGNGENLAGGGGGGYYGGGQGDNSTGGGGGSGYVGSLSSSQNIIGTSSMPSLGGGSETGHAGNGNAKITFISQ